MSLLRGTVVDNQDPMKRGRCRVYVWGVHKKEDPNLPWAETAGSTMFGLHRGSGYSGVLQKGTTVWVQFEQNDIQCPIIVGVFVGHEAETMGDVSPENSDFSGPSKADYGNVWQLTTPGGLGITFNDNKKTVEITNGSSRITLKGSDMIVDANMTVNGHITAQGVFAPNLCTCGSPGIPYPGSPSGSPNPSGKTPEEIAKDNKCEPKDCSVDFGTNNDTSDVHPYMAVLLKEAQNIYKEDTGNDFYVCETTVSPDKMACNMQAHENPEERYPLNALCGLAIKVAPDEKSCNIVDAELEDPAANPDDTPPDDGYNIECGEVAIPQLQAFKVLISKGEGGPQAFNRGVAGDSPNEKIDFTKMTFGQYFQRTAKYGNPGSKQNTIFAWGSYQMIPVTTKENLPRVNLSESDYMTTENREKLFTSLIKHARPPIYKYLTGQSEDVNAAALALAQEWSSFGIPYAIGSKQKDQSYHGNVGGNKASKSSASAIKSLIDLKAGITAVAKAKNITLKEAFECVFASHTGPDGAAADLPDVNLDNRPFTEPKPPEIDSKIKDAFIEAQKNTQVAKIKFLNNWVVIDEESCEDDVFNKFADSIGECGVSAGIRDSDTEETPEVDPDDSSYPGGGGAGGGGAGGSW